MKYRIHGHRHADFLFRELGEYACLWGEIEDALASISDDMIIKEFEGEARKAISISQAIYRLVKAELVKRAWRPESYIFESVVALGMGKSSSLGYDMFWIVADCIYWVI